jgi:hypothetical protein
VATRPARDSLGGNLTAAPRGCWIAVRPRKDYCPGGLVPHEAREPAEARLLQSIGPALPSCAHARPLAPLRSP